MVVGCGWKKVVWLIVVESGGRWLIVVESGGRWLIVVGSGGRWLIVVGGGCEIEEQTLTANVLM